MPRAACVRSRDKRHARTTLPGQPTHTHAHALLNDARSRFSAVSSASPSARDLRATASPSSWEGGPARDTGPCPPNATTTNHHYQTSGRRERERETHTQHKRTLSLSSSSSTTTTALAAAARSRLRGIVVVMPSPSTCVSPPPRDPNRVESAEQNTCRSSPRDARMTRSRGSGVANGRTLSASLPYSACSIHTRSV